MTETTTATPRLVTVKDAAVQLGCTREQVYAFMREGALAWVSYPPHGSQQTGRRIEQSEIDAFIDRNRQRASA